MLRSCAATPHVETPLRCAFTIWFETTALENSLINISLRRYPIKTAVASHVNSAREHHQYYPVQRLLDMKCIQDSMPCGGHSSPSPTSHYRQSGRPCGFGHELPKSIGHTDRFVTKVLAYHKIIVWDPLRRALIRQMANHLTCLQIMIGEFTA